MCDVNDCKVKSKHKVSMGTRHGEYRREVELCDRHYAEICGDIAYSIGYKVPEKPAPAYVIFNIKELAIILKFLQDNYNGWSFFSKAPELKGIDARRKYDENKIMSFNKDLWKLLGNGLEMQILVMTPINEIPLLINEYGDSIFNEFVKLRLRLGK